MSIRRAAATWAALALMAFAAQAARITAVTPAGEVPEVRQVSVRFSEAVVTAGDPRLPAPVTLQCSGGAPAGDGRWLDAQRWVYDLREPLLAGNRCTLQAAAGWKPLTGTLEGPTEFRFSTGAPTPTRIDPYPGATIEEEQHFLLLLNGAVDAATVQKSAWCEVEGLGDRIAVRVVGGAARESVLRERRVKVPARALLLACDRVFPADAGVRLVWGPGIAAAGQPALVTTAPRPFEWTVRPRFTAEFSCEREQANKPCLPLRPMTLRFAAPVPREQALAARLVPAAGGTPIAPKTSSNEAGPLVNEVQFPAPLPENARFTLTLPATLKDDGGRALANAGSFPLAVATGGMPPLAKFAAAPFGIVEAGPEALLPLTLRHVQADLQGATTTGQVRVRRLAPDRPDAELLAWIAKLARYHESELSAKEAGLPRGEWMVIEREPDEKGRLRDVKRERRIATRELSLLKTDAEARRTELPKPTASEPRATEVIGVPLPQPGYHVVEVESKVLGDALLATRAPMYVRTGVLVTNLGVHFKRGRSTSLVWVTSLDRGRPVAGARVAVNDCRGQPIWSGTTDAAGLARVDRGFDDDLVEGEKCTSTQGLFVTARTADDLGWVFSSWNRGIEPWRFKLPTTSEPRSRVAHTVLDRTLLRAGETVSMKHYMRDETAAGLAMVAADALPDQLVVTHVGSGSETLLPITWSAGGRASESRWAIPKTAKLGLYELSLKKGDRRWSSGNVRVEAFRVPLVDAQLSGPRGVLVAPAQLPMAVQLNMNAGGPLAKAPARLSALLQNTVPSFPAFDDFEFSPPRARRDGPDRDDDAEGPARLVADKLDATTDARGAASVAIPGLPKLEAPADLTAELTFNDPNGEVQTVSRRLRLWPSAVVVGLRARNWTASQGELRFDAIVLDTDGKPLAGREVEVVGRLQQTYSVRKRIVGGFYAYDSHSQSRDLGRLCQGKSDAQGRVACVAQTDAVGEIELIARARDDAQRVAQAATSIWVAGDGEQWFEQGNDDRIDVLPEQRELQPGQTAKLQVRMPFRAATALVSVEREGVVDARVVRLSGRTPIVEVPIPSGDAASYAPNVMVSVMVLRGRVRDVPWTSFFSWGWRSPIDWWRAFRDEGPDWRAPTAMVDLAKPAFRFGVAELKVGVAQHRLDVKVVPEKATYGVRETVRTTVTVTRGGKPAADAEVAFAAVDEGLLALRGNDSWNLLDALMRRRGWGVETATAQSEVIGRRHYGRKALPPGGDGGGNPTRELFDTLLLWRGTVKLDAQGQARIDVPLNDSLTSFRLVAIADAGADRFGTGNATVRVSQDLQLYAGLPPVVRDGDRFDAMLTLRNATPRPMTVKATLASNQAPALPEQTVQLAAGQSTELRWPVTVPASFERLEWTATAIEQGTGTAKDALTVKQAVQPAVPVRVWQSTLQQIDGPLSIPAAPPADALPGAGGVQAGLQRTLGSALPGLRRWFEVYPFSCLEQRSSRAIALRDEARWQTITAEVDAYLDADGLASYFPLRAEDGSRGSDRLTAYLLAAAHERGWAWPDGARERMLQGLAAFVDGRLERRSRAPRPDLDVRKLAALEALARHGRVQPRMLGSLDFAGIGQWPTAALLDWWSILRRVEAIPDRTAKLDQVQNLLRARLVQGGTTLKFSTEESDFWWWLMDSPDGNAARLLLAAVQVPAWKDDVPRLVAGHLARQQRGAWLTTTANLWSALALERFSAAFESQPVAGRTQFALGATTRTVDWPPGGDPAVQALPWPAAAGPFTAQHQGTGKPWLTMQTLAAVPLKAPLAAGYRIQRSITAVERKVADAWSRGDIVRVRLEIEATGDMTWVAVQDPLPAGAALLGSGLGRDSAIATRDEKREGSAWLAYEERGQDAWRGYYEWLPRGRHVVEYTMRLNNPGRFQLPPTRVEAMYAPETFGERPGEAVEVRP